MTKTTAAASTTATTAPEQSQVQSQLHVQLQSQVQSQNKANKDLTPEERKAKLHWKKEYREEQKRRRLESRLKHALQRKDAVVERQMREALEQKQMTTTKQQTLPPSMTTIADTTTTLVGNHHNQQHHHHHQEQEEAKLFVRKIAQQLQQKQPTRHGAAKKQFQTEQARHLLKHMTKGTQHKGMFENEDALWGYARQKFVERAMLVCHSFCQLQYLEVVVDTTTTTKNRKKDLLWNRLLNVQTICSIGCGPGNDVVGVVAFLRTQQQQKQNNSFQKVLPHVLCLDYVMDEWQTVLSPLQEIMVGSHVNTMSLESCDVTQSLSDVANERAKHLLFHQRKKKKKDDDDEKHNHEVDLYLFSYVLTETRGKWEPFVRDLLHHAPPGSLFYFAEPTPWQLHPVRTLDGMETVWLDSSMNASPSQQASDKRFGPAVLLGRKKKDS